MVFKVIRTAQDCSPKLSTAGNLNKQALFTHRYPSLSTGGYLYNLQTFVMTVTNRNLNFT